MEILKSVDAVIDALGGNKPVVELFGFKAPSTVSNWRRDGRFPADTYAAFERALAGLNPPRMAAQELWKMRS